MNEKEKIKNIIDESGVNSNIWKKVYNLFIFTLLFLIDLLIMSMTTFATSIMLTLSFFFLIVSFVLRFLIPVMIILISVYLYVGKYVFFSYVDKLFYYYIPNGFGLIFIVVYIVMFFVGLYYLVDEYKNKLITVHNSKIK